MATNKPDEKLLQQLNQHLDDSVDALDARTLSKLNQARHRAIEQKTQLRGSWIASAAFATILVIVTAGWLINTQMHTSPQNNINAGYDDIELIDDLEFITWLAEQEGSG